MVDALMALSLSEAQERLRAWVQLRASIATRQQLLSWANGAVTGEVGLSMCGLGGEGAALLAATLPGCPSCISLK